MGRKGSLFVKGCELRGLCNRFCISSVFQYMECQAPWNELNKFLGCTRAQWSVDDEVYPAADDISRVKTEEKNESTLKDWLEPFDGIERSMKIELNLSHGDCTARSGDIQIADFIGDMASFNPENSGSAPMVCTTWCYECVVLDIMDSIARHIVVKSNDRSGDIAG